ncbi:MAG: hypothetical protein IT422_16080 [Pirellulaceae bacterium]|jgi:hypothetical protein|nr:hypothetical protein [Pirellulaceae bacterium]
MVPIAKTRFTLLLLVVGLMIGVIAGCTDHDKELDKMYGLDVPGNPFVDYSVDLRAAMGSLRNDNPADAAEMLSAYTEADFPGGEDVFTEMKTKLDALVSGKALEGGKKPTTSEVQALLKKLIDLSRPKPPAAPAEPAATK